LEQFFTLFVVIASLLTEEDIAIFYFAYGSNLWLQQMAARCPGHQKIGTGRLTGWRWIITTRGYANIVESKDEYVLGVVYELTAADEISLDRYEGVSQGSYRKEMMTVDVEGRQLNCLVYIDPIVAVGEPKVEYIKRLQNGIQDAGFPNEYVTLFLRQSVPEQQMS
jgi:cation transport regulator ChaC